MNFDTCAFREGGGVVSYGTKKVHLKLGNLVPQAGTTLSGQSPGVK